MTRAKPLSERIQRFAAVTPSGCWLWTGNTNNWGYGLMTVRRDGKQATALVHRLSYEMARGPVPDGLQLDHLCRNRSCVNPDHLDPVTGRENTLRSPLAVTAINARKSHCPQGHPYNEVNTLVSGGYRYCRPCRRARDTARRNHSKPAVQS